MTAPSNAIRANVIRIGREALICLRCLLSVTVVLFGTTSLRGAIVGKDWWLTAPSDPAWINKPAIELRAAAERGDAAAQFYYARALFIGEGRQRNPSEALRWTHRAAEQGYVEAQYTLARFHYDAVATPHDHDEAFAWLSRAVKQGHVDAMTVMGWAYTFGEGVPIDGNKAREWLERALNAGATGASWAFGNYYLSGEAGLAQRTNYVEALRWFERAAAKGNVTTMFTVADLVEKGLGTPPDFTRALVGFRQCADSGNPDAMERLASIYSAGQAEPRNADDAPIILLRHSAVTRAIDSFAAGERSMALIGTARDLWNHYRFGIGTVRDHLAAAEWMWVVYQNNLLRNPSHDSAVGGQSRPEHPFEPIVQGRTAALNADERLWHQAVRLVHEALDEGKAEAWFKIGESYRDGSKLSPKQSLMAWAWFAHAAELNHAPARAALQALEASFNPEELTKAKRFWVPAMKRQDAP